MLTIVLNMKQYAINGNDVFIPAECLFKKCGITSSYLIFGGF